MLTEKIQREAARRFVADWTGRAHRNNDRAVLRAYGFPTNDTFTESDCVARLFQLYADWGK